MKSMIKKVILNTVGFVTIIAIALLTDEYLIPQASIGITTGSLAALTIIYNAIKRYIIGKKEETRIEHELIEQCMNEIEGLRFEIQEMREN